VSETRSRGRVAVVASGVVVCLVAVVSLYFGAAHIPPVEIVRALVSRTPLLGNLFLSEAWAGSLADASVAILVDVRLPRVLLAGLVGAALAASGVVTQAVFRNPMADPFILGIASGAALGATCAFVARARWEWMGLGAVPMMAFGGAAAAMALLGVLARGPRSGPATLLLTGIALSSLLTAGTSLVIVFRERDVGRVLFWLMGSFSHADWQRVCVVFLASVVPMAVVLWHARELNALVFGDEQAHHLGVDVRRVRRRLLISVSLLTAAAVSACGIVGFVGLMAPHIVRLRIGPDHRALTPAAAFVGATLVMGVDTLARTVVAPVELPVGAVLALLGGPFLILLLRSRRAWSM
jgi:iron complex transport system permease protein